MTTFVIMACNMPRLSDDAPIQKAMILRDHVVIYALHNGFFDELSFCWGFGAAGAYLRFEFCLPDSPGPLGHPSVDRRWTIWRPVGRPRYPYGLRIYTVRRNRWRNVLAISWGADGTAVHHITPGLWQRDLRQLAAKGRSTNADRLRWARKRQFRPRAHNSRVAA